ncbi:hypothetical protein CCAX7_54780 [Capsulimonas corticalis]|uniref:Uncharacterized protein n=1 Tax=Capsulimonas corticalis TaxID=2219043 RepID=A0A402D5S1_9BACT|nr:hypothetical protein [Capsulimonas corticalis]BDI33427.1 hypothetical protein CCAX7_54780 [Capsulimonas corticalis]
MPSYPGDDGSLILHFGSGDIAICPSKGLDRECEDEIAFIVHEPGEVGRYYGEWKGKSTSELNTPVRMIFDTVDALDVVVEQLTTLRFKMTGDEQPTCQVQAGFAWTDMAASAYRAYAASTGNKNFRGEPMPAFDDLPVAIQTAWEAAVRHVGNAIENPRALNSTKEQSWQHWVRPQDKEANHV